ncbi:MAG: transposase [Halobacteriales archaeon]
MISVDLPDRNACFDHLRDTRFGETIACVYCGSESIKPMDTTTAKGAQQYRCTVCNRQFNDLTNTVFEEREFSLEEMFYIIKQIDAKPIAEIQRDLGRVHYEPVLRFVHLVEAMHPERSTLPLDELCDNELLYSAGDGSGKDDPK